MTSFLWCGIITFSFHEKCGTAEELSSLDFVSLVLLDFLWSSVVRKGKCTSSPAYSVSIFMSRGRIQQDTRGFSFSCSSRCLEADAYEDDGKNLLTGYVSCQGSESLEVVESLGFLCLKLTCSNYCDPWETCVRVGVVFVLFFLSENDTRTLFFFFFWRGGSGLKKLLHVK